VVAINENVACAVNDATDKDHWKRGSQEGDEDDVIRYKWSANGGVFTDPNQQSTGWKSDKPGTFTLKCTIDDQWEGDAKGITPPGESGTRNDDPLPERTVEVRVGCGEGQRWDGDSCVAESEETGPMPGDDGTCGDGTHWDASQNKCVSDDEAEDGKIVTMKVTRLQSGKPFAAFASVAAGGLDPAEHWAKVEITVTDPEGVPMEGVELSEPWPAWGGRQGPYRAEVWLNSYVTDANGKAFGYYWSGSMVERVVIKFELGPVIKRTASLYQEWDATPQTPQAFPYFDYDQPSPVTWLLRFNDPTAVPINQHRVEFELGQIGGAQWNAALEDYEYVTFNDPDIPADWKGLVTYDTPLQTGSGTYTGNLTVKFNSNFMLDSVGTDVIDADVFTNQLTAGP
jgi:hypothetical protein